MEATFEIYPSGSDWRWRLKAANGENVASGEAYTSKDAAKAGVEAVKRAAAAATVEEV